MKFENLQSLYVKEKKRLMSPGEESARVQTERRLKQLYDAPPPPTTRQQDRPDLPEEKVGAEQVETKRSGKRMKMKARAGPYSKKKKAKTSSPAQPEQQKVLKKGQAAETEKEATQIDIDSMIIFEEQQPTEATPLNIKQPAIVDWFSEVVDNRDGFKIIRADNSSCRYSSFSRMVKRMTRDDLNEMFIVGTKKYANLKEFNENKLIMEYLKMMFAPEEENSIFGKIFSPVTFWQVHESSGVYSVTKLDGTVEYYLVERKYNHGLSMMTSMVQRKLNACQGSTLASELAWKITRQIHELQTKSKSRA